MKDILRGVADGLIPCIFVIAIITMIAVRRDLNQKNDKLMEEINELQEQVDRCLAAGDKCVAEMRKCHE